MWLFMRPADVLFFRDHRAFAAGESHYARNRFPPTPTPVAGALRAKVLRDHDVDFSEFREWGPSRLSKPVYEALREWIGTPHDCGRLGMKGPLLGWRDAEGRLCCCYWPAPLDQFTMGSLGPLRRVIPDVVCNWPAPLALTWEKERPGASSNEPLGDTVIDNGDLFRYLTGEVLVTATKRRSLYELEPRIGIGLAASRTAESGKLYLATPARLKEETDSELGLIVHLSDEKAQPISSGPCALGGERRVADCRQIKLGDKLNWLLAAPGTPVLANLENDITKSGRFKIYLATPAVFANGWLPDFLQLDHGGVYRGAIGGLTVKLVAAAVGKPVAEGGWNYVGNEPKPLYKAVPAGSVYCFEVEGNAPSDLGAQVLQQFHFQTTLQQRAVDMFRPLAQAGFGLSFAASWNYRKRWGES